MKTLRSLLVTAAAAAMVLLLAQPASAQPVQPRPNDGVISLLKATCGSADNWQEQAAHMGVTAKDRYWLYLGKTYDIDCSLEGPQTPGGDPPPAPDPAPAVLAPSGSWVNPLPGTCRPPGGGGQYHAPRDRDGDGYYEGIHEGIDLGAIEDVPMDTQVIAAHEGTVTRRGNFGNAGGQLQIASGEWLVTYNHLHSFDVEVGQFVAAGQPIAKMGGARGTWGAGDATGPHLHVEIRQNGELKDPAGILPVRC